ncbi:CheR family methyltransferase [Pedobacter hiemivivus]|uniref:Protein-glutamate O-methyltransferase CheR n=1 Tax=Pedobacter hiemivivus TaxID=2530454 RepID=A0A4R0MIC1_9SPHI|nr:protein-glutamate O-methyltransferase CheR [Pedobacter hiemivivus]TCC86290.1 protein-glutamate O-methyltransferase CheR [Pedobacter hiemivivus]
MDLSVITDEHVEILLSDLLEQYGYDFTGYSRASIKRRISRIYTLDRALSFAEFRYRILNDQAYFKRFVEQITVNVTEMFRDPSFFRKLREEVLPKLGTYPLIRIWLAGCSTGEEAYSISIILKELNLLHKSLIYATDLNPTVLEKAAQSIFAMSQMQQYSENYILSGGTKEFSSYYTASYSLAKFDDELKRKIVFSTHNLVSDHSFNEFQLILCRNVLIYFNRDLQHNVLDLFDSSLDELGYLALGSKETVEFSRISNRYKRLPGEKIWRKVG